MSTFINLGTIKFKTLTSKITSLGQERLSGFGFFWKNKWSGNKNDYLNCFCFNSATNTLLKDIYETEINENNEIDVIVSGDISINYDQTNGHCYPSLYIEKIIPLNNLASWNKNAIYSAVNDFFSIKANKYKKINSTALNENKNQTFTSTEDEFTKLKQVAENQKNSTLVPSTPVNNETPDDETLDDALTWDSF